MKTHVNGELTPPRSPSVAWLALFAALLGWSFDGIEMGVFPLIARPALLEFLGVNVDEEVIRRWNGVFAAAFLMGAAFGGLIFGRLGDFIGRVRALSISVLVYALLTGASAFAQSPSQLACLRFLAAIGMGGEWALGVALVIETWPERVRPWLVGSIAAAVNVGYVAIALVARVVEPATQWRMLLGICVAPALLAFFVRAFVPESEVWQKTVQILPRASWRELFELAYRQRILVGTAAGAVLMLAVWGGVQFTQLWAAQLAGGAAAANVQFVSAASAAIGAIVVPPLSVKRSRRLGWCTLCVASLIISEVFFVGCQRYGQTFLLAVAALGFATGGVTGWLTMYLSELFPTRIRATGMGVCYNSGRVLAAAGVLLTIGPLDVQGDYAMAGAVVSLVYFAGLLITPWIIESSLTDD